MVRTPLELVQTLLNHEQLTLDLVRSRLDLAQLVLESGTINARVRANAA
ncbi:MAG: hypothetical protein IPI81_10675 [Flavobacteriales bacterium]|nr:hypothetical protein [Flavobacteriales bacterium]